MNLYAHNFTTQNLLFILGFTLGVVYSTGLDKCVIHVSIIMVIIEYFHCLKTLLCSTYSFLPSFFQPLATIDLFTVSIVLTFLECHSRRDFPGDAGGKEPACQFRRHKRCGFNPWVRKVPWRRKWQPMAVFLPEEYHWQGNLVGYSP